MSKETKADTSVYRYFSTGESLCRQERTSLVELNEGGVAKYHILSISIAKITLFIASKSKTYFPNMMAPLVEA